jgi:23S rRNA (guanosine2251-2'-O)-methyltransferase
MGGTSVTQMNISGRIVLVLGSEGKGLSRLVRESCDALVRIPMRGHVGSFNASVAAGILLFEIRRQQDISNGGE